MAGEMTLGNKDWKIELMEDGDWRVLLLSVENIEQPNNDDKTVCLKKHEVTQLIGALTLMRDEMQ